ncbi:hypothetical protein [Pedobacter agri]|nr:hypothetical protein [Pedobacter agri]
MKNKAAVPTAEVTNGAKVELKIEKRNVSIKGTCGNVKPMSFTL